LLLINFDIAKIANKNDITKHNSLKINKLNFY